MKEKKFYGYRVAVGCGIVISLHFGCTCIWSAMIPYFLEQFDCSLTVLSASSALCALIGFLASFAVGELIQKWTPRILLVISTLICGAFMLVNAFASAPWMLYISNGLSGITLAWGAQVTCASLINRWFVDKRNTIIGFVFGCSAFGGALFMFLGGNLINTLGQRGIYLLLGVITVACSLFCELFLIQDCPEQLGQQALGSTVSQYAEQTACSPAGAAPSITLAEAKRSLSFYLMIVATFFASMLLTTFSSFATTFWVTNGLPQASAATYASIMTLIGGPVSALVGGVADRWGIKAFLCSIFIAFAIGLIMAIAWGTILPVQQVLLLNLIFISTGNCIKNISASVVFPVFGPLAADKINGALMAFFYAGSALCVVAFGALFDALGSFIPVFVSLLALTAISLSLMLLAVHLAPIGNNNLEKFHTER